MISVPEALDILQKNVPEPRTIKKPLTEIFGCRLSNDIVAPEPSPRYTSSAMDGFAIKYSDFVQSPSFTIVGESQAGVPFQNILDSGEAIRISTGAMIPKGADTVVRVEDTEEKSNILIVKRCRKKGQDIRFKGEEFAQGTLLLAKGQVVKTREIALLSAVGVYNVAVYDSPRVALFITGTELAHSGSQLIAPHQVRDSNAPMLQSTILESGGTVVDCTHVEDDFEKTVSSIQESYEKNCDIILCSGGVSVGRHDHVKDAAEKIGFTRLFWKIRQKPGKPLFVAKKDSTLLFGLPGNPVSAFMCFQNFVLPTLASLQGVDFLQQKVSACAETPVTNSGKRTNFIRVKVNNTPNTIPSFSPIPQQGSHMLTSIVRADGYISLEPGATRECGEIAEVVLF